MTMAVAPHTPVSNSVPSSTSAASLSSKKQEHLIAGRRRLEEFKQKRRREPNAVAPSSKQNGKEATRQVISSFLADGLSSAGEAIEDSPSNFEGKIGNNSEISNKQNFSLGKTVVDVKGATASPALPVEQLHTHSWNDSSPQIFSENKDSTAASPIVDIQLIRRVTNDEDRPFSRSLFNRGTSPQTYMKQDESLLPKTTNLGSDDARHEVRKNPSLVANVTTGSTPFSAWPSMLATDLTYKDLSINSWTGSILDDGRTLEHNGSTGVRSFLTNVTDSESARDKKQHDDVHILRAEGNGSWHEKESAVQDQHATTFRYSDNTHFSSRNKFVLPDILHTNSEIVFSRQEAPSSWVIDGSSSNPSATDSLKEPSKITDSPLNPVKTEHKDAGEREHIFLQSNSVVLGNSHEASHPYIGDKFSSSGSFEKLRPSLDRSDEFASLEQHIEDLTQEKFSLQRGLDAARALAESLAQESSALTEDFNQQGALVNELKGEVEKQQSELHAQTLIMNNLKLERDKAQQESVSAVERSQAFAAEVVNLEERILKIRSQELKLEKEVKALMSENESQKSQMSSMEKDQTNIRSMIEALQEEKKVLQSLLRKATNDLEDVRKSSKETTEASFQAQIKVDASTSTTDLGVESKTTRDASALLGSTSSNVALCEIQSSLIELTSQDLNSLHVPSPWASVPSEHLRKVENINMLVTELAEEKAALLKTLKVESVAAVELRALNAELSRKLELQTQQLELAVAQRMAHEGNPINRNVYEMPAAGPEFVDEGDEVVERVLGWIMKLFPGGSSRRSGGKHL